MYPPNPPGPPNPTPGRGLRGPHAAIWVALIVCGTLVLLCLLPCILLGGCGAFVEMLPDPPSPKP